MLAKKNYKFVDCVIAVTYRCNSRCTMCNIWQIKDNPKLTLDDLKKLPKTLKDINISGGEPFLRPDLPEVIRVVTETCPKARITISSNGFMTDFIVKQMKKILEVNPNVGIVISIDGLEKKHDEVRRIPDGFKKDMETIRRLREELGMKNVRIAFTAGDYNIDELPNVYKLSRELGIEMTLAAVHNSENFFNIQTNKIEYFEPFKKNFNWLIKQELSTFSPKRWVRAFFTYGLLTFVTTRKRVLPSYGGKRAFFMDPDGDVYPSDIATHKMGNLKDFDSFDALMDSDNAREVLEKGPEVFDKSWMICTTRASIKRHPLFVIGWIFRNLVTRRFSK